MSRTLAVSDHAVLRYLERVYGLDADAIRAEILAGMSERTRAALAVTGGTVLARYRPARRGHRPHVVKVAVVAPRGGQSAVITSILPHK